MTKGIEFLFKKNKITWLQGFGKFVAGGDTYTIEVANGDKKETITAKHVIVATGSKARHLPGITVDNVKICDNEGALAFDAVPKRLGVIGAGVIGLELGSVWRRLGSEVTILEALPTFLGACDEAIAKEAWKVFTKEQGLNIKLGVKIDKVTRARPASRSSTPTTRASRRSSSATSSSSRSAACPTPTASAPPPWASRSTSAASSKSTSHCKTNLPNVYAIGDVVRGPMLAHKAEDEGVMVAEMIAGQKPHLDYNCIPWIIYTSPEVAWVGKTEQQ